MQDPRDFPTAADYAQAAADRAHGKLDRIEKALTAAGLLPPEPAPVPRRSWSEVLKEHYASALDGVTFDGFVVDDDGGLV